MHFPSACSLPLWWLLSTRASARPDRPLSLFGRDDSSLSCSAVDSKLPGDFTCPSGSNCISLDNSSSALCCPETDSCANIQTITCSVQAQNASANAHASVFTTRLGDKLPTCGDACCPFGYACIASQSGPSICNIIADTSKTTASTNSSSASSTPSTSTATTTTTSTSHPTISAGVSSTASEVAPRCNKFPIGVFFAGFFPGIFIGAFLMLAWVICSGRHHTPGPNGNRDSTASSFYGPPTKPTISDPIPMDSAGGMRTDFLRRTRGRAKSMFSTKSQQTSPKLAPSHWKMPTPPVPNNVPATTPGLPVTPERRLAHELGSESITVYSPSDGPIQPVTAAHIAPLRGMASQRYAPQVNNMGSPFKSPANPDGRQAGRVSMSSRISSPSDDNGYEPEVLTPARYEGAGWTPPTKRVRRVSSEPVSRPNTTFTEMLQEVGFPDPIQNQGTPAVPKIPNAYGGRTRS